VPEFLQNKLLNQIIHLNPKMPDGNLSLSQVLMMLRQLQLKIADTHKLIPSTLMIEGVSQKELRIHYFVVLMVMFIAQSGVDRLLHSRK
jgi:hypothetical protein